MVSFKIKPPPPRHVETSWMTGNGSATVTITENPFFRHTIDPTVKLLLASYYTLILVLCWSGNSFTLYATIRHNAIKLDKLSVWIIQNLCVADILHGLLTVRTLRYLNFNMLMIFTEFILMLQHH